MKWISKAERERSLISLKKNNSSSSVKGIKKYRIVLETKKPQVRGVLVVAKGAENVQIEKRIIESVTKLLDVPSHRVSVMPRK